MMAVRGVWTPRAEVPCLSCHGQRTWNGRKVPADDTWQRRNEPDEAETRCDGCGRAIIVGADVAALHRVRHALQAAGVRRAVMEQTGGMFAAVLVPAADGARVQVHVDEGAPDGGFVIARAERDDDAEAVIATVRGTAAAVAAVRRALAERGGGK